MKNIVAGMADSGELRRALRQVWVARQLVKFGPDQVVYVADLVVFGTDPPGSVIAELPYRPQEPTLERWVYRTEVHTAYDGTERRTALRTKPRRILDYAYSLTDEEMRQLRAQLRNDTQRTWAVPLWHEAFRVTGAASDGGATVDCDFTNHDILDRRLVYIDPEVPGQRGEFATVSGIAGSTLTITGTWSKAYAVGSRFYPAVRARIADAQSFSRPGFGGFAHVSMTLVATDLFALGGAGAALATYQALTLLDVRPISRAETSEQAFRGVEVIDFGAAQSLVAGADIAELTRGQQYRIGSRADLQYWKKLSDGSILQRRVTLVTDNGDGTSTLTLDAALPAGSYTVFMVSHLEQVRLGTDELRLTHSSTLSTIEIALRTVEQ